MSKRLVCAVLLVPAVVACSGSSSSSSSSKSPSPTASSSSTAPKEQLVATFKGSGNSTTKSFEVKKGWELRYEIENKKPITIDLLGSSGSKVSTPVDFKGPGGGSVYPTQTGTFSLKIMSTGQWLVRIFNH